MLSPVCREPSSATPAPKRAIKRSLDLVFGIVLFLVFLPFIDKNPAVEKRKRPVALFIGAAVLVAMAILTYYGAQIPAAATPAS